MTLVKKIRRRIYNISKKTGDKFGFDLPYFVENGFWALFSQFVAMAASFAVSIIFARQLPKSVFGEYQLVLSVIGMLGILSFSGLNTSIIRSVARGFDYSYVKAVNFSFRKSLFTFPIFTGIAIWYYFHNNEELAAVFIAAAILFSFIYAHNKWLSFRKGKEQFELIAKQQIIQNIILASALIGVAFLFPENVFFISLTYLIINAGFHTFWHIKTKKIITTQNVDDECIPYGKFMTGLGILSSIINYFDKIIIGFLDIKLLAVYAIALKLFEVLKQLLKSFFSVSMPKFAKKNVKVSNRIILLLMFIGLISGIILYIFSEPLIHLLYTGKYDASADLFKKILIVLPFLFINPLLVNKISAQKIKKRIKFVKIYTPLISLILSVVVFLLSSNLEYFVLAKIYSYYFFNFIFLVPWFVKD